MLVARLASELEKAIGDKSLRVRIVLLVPLSDTRDNDLAVFRDDGAVRQGDRSFRHAAHGDLVVDMLA